MLLFKSRQRHRRLVDLVEAAVVGRVAQGVDDAVDRLGHATLTPLHIFDQLLIRRPKVINLQRIDILLASIIHVRQRQARRIVRNRIVLRRVHAVADGCSEFLSLHGEAVPILRFVKRYLIHVHMPRQLVPIDRFIAA